MVCKCKTQFSHDTHTHKSIELNTVYYHTCKSSSWYSYILATMALKVNGNMRLPNNPANTALRHARTVTMTLSIWTTNMVSRNTKTSRLIYHIAVMWYALLFIKLN